MIRLHLLFQGWHFLHQWCLLLVKTLWKRHKRLEISWDIQNIGWLILHQIRSDLERGKGIGILVLGRRGERRREPTQFLESFSFSFHLSLEVNDLTSICCFADPFSIIDACFLPRPGQKGECSVSNQAKFWPDNRTFWQQVIHYDGFLGHP